MEDTETQCAKLREDPFSPPRTAYPTATLDGLLTARADLDRRIALAQAAVAQEEGTPSMPRVNGKRFFCTECGAGVFTRRGDIYTCSGCQTQYEGS
jgi:hypothetical protein